MTYALSWLRTRQSHNLSGNSVSLQVSDEDRRWWGWLAKTVELQVDEVGL